MPTFNFGAQLLATLRFADLIDVMLVAALLYALLTWLRRSTSPVASRRLAAAALLFGGLYLLANSFELFLVESFLRVLFLAALLAVVVVFQTEIRQMLTHIGTFNPFASSTRSDETILDQLAEASAHLADAKVGALIALKGQETWADLVHGGVALDGLVSQPLLYSLFDPETHGHDGAVLIEGQRITRFAAHLPLATDLPAASRFGGTRHAAALGLTQHCDALVIVVSEERGVVSVAEGSQLDELNHGDLKARLEAFWQQHYTKTTRSSKRWLPKLQLVSLSLTASALLWLLFAYSPETVSRTLSVPVEFRNVPADWELTEVSPELIQTTLVGSERAFDQLDRDALTFSFDLSAPRGGLQRFVVNENHLELPANLRLNSLRPQEVRINAQHLVATEVRVEVPTLGVLPEPLRLTGIQTEPQTLMLLMPEGEAARPQQVATEPLDLRNVSNETTTERSLVLPPGWQLAEGQDSSVEVTVSVQE